MNRRRLFFALWPDEAVRDAVVAAGEAAAKAGGIRGRRMQDERIHMTLLFLGDLDADGEAQARAVAAGIRVPPFQLTLDQAGSFYRAKVLWVGAQESPPELMALHLGLRDGLARLIGDKSREALAPHLTCHRDISRPLKIAPVPPIRWAVDRFVLVHSELGASARYHVVSQWPLQT